MVLKTSNESAFGVDRFNSTDTTSGHYLPVVSVDYGSPVGNPSTSTYLTQQLTRHSTAGVNPATGNLLVRTTDLSVHGTGLDLAYEHDYNSLLARDLHAPAVPRSPMGGELGHGWTGSLGDDVWLDRSEGSTVFHSPQGNLVFTQSRFDGPWTAPAGINATLLAGATFNTPNFPDERLTFHDGGLTYHFDNLVGITQGELTSITTKNGKSMNFDVNENSTHQAGTTALTDTQGRKFPVTYLPPYYGNALQSVGDTAPPSPSTCSARPAPPPATPSPATPATRRAASSPARTGNTPGQTANSYYLRDSLGSTIGLTDGTGARTASYLYDPYGQTTSSSGTAAAANPFRYAGGYQDPTGLYHFGQRYYDPFTVLRNAGRCSSGCRALPGLPLRGIATWDYTAHLAEFTAWLHAQAARTPVVNPPSATEGNLHKSYLLDLAAAGVPLPTTRLLRAGDAVDEQDLGRPSRPTVSWPSQPSEPEGGG